MIHILNGVFLEMSGKRDMFKNKMLESLVRMRKKDALRAVFEVKGSSKEGLHPGQELMRDAMNRPVVLDGTERAYVLYSPPLAKVRMDGWKGRWLDSKPLQHEVSILAPRSFEFFKME